MSAWYKRIKIMWLFGLRYNNCTLIKPSTLDYMADRLTGRKRIFVPYKKTFIWINVICKFFRLFLSSIVFCCNIWDSVSRTERFRKGFPHNNVSNIYGNRLTDHNVYITDTYNCIKHNALITLVGLVCWRFLQTRKHVLLAVEWLCHI